MMLIEERQTIERRIEPEAGCCEFEVHKFSYFTSSPKGKITYMPASVEEVLLTRFGMSVSKGLKLKSEDHLIFLNPSIRPRVRHPSERLRHINPYAARSPILVASLLHRTAFQICS
ncbi:hypothetical protein IG631_10797 [Alternaria alternata]|nr:hypothetical protein IG631_10797 [Alternaria alternata]